MSFPKKNTIVQSNTKKKLQKTVANECIIKLPFFNKFKGLRKCITKNILCLIIEEHINVKPFLKV